MVITNTPDFLLIQNIRTGEQAIVDKKMTRYKRLCLGFLNSLRLTPRFVKHIVLTQAVESYRPSILNNFMFKMRRYYGNVLYMWTIEVQDERYKKYGDRVLHWHVIVAFDYRIRFGSDDVKRIQKYWKYGQIEVIPVRKPNLVYLLKYITKSLDVDLTDVFKVRRIGSSQIGAYLRQSWRRLRRASSWLAPVGITFDKFKGFYWSASGNAYVEVLDEQLELAGYKYKKERICVYHKERSDWFK